ncbi:MAG: hypothetical protein ABJA62_10710 [Luteimonas sp.]
MNKISKKWTPAIALGVIAIVVLGGLVWRQALLRTNGPVLVSAGTDESSQTAFASTSARPSNARNLARRAPLSAMERLKINEERKRSRKAHTDKMLASVAALAAKQRAEPVDPKWAPAMETRLQDAVQQSQFKEAGAIPTSLEIDCKTTTCRIDAGLANRSSASDFAMLYMSGAGSNLKHAYSSVVTDPDGSSHVVIYGVGR